MRLVPSNMFKPSSNFVSDRSNAALLLLILFVICVSCLSLSYCHVCFLRLLVTCWERSDLLALLCVMFPCVFVILLYGVLGQVWYLIVSISDLCLLPNFKLLRKSNDSLKTFTDELQKNVETASLESTVLFLPLHENQVFMIGKNEKVS